MGDQTRPLILISDNDPSVCHLLNHRLNDWGYRTDSALNTVDLYELLSLEEPAILLLDLSFGENTAFDVMRDVLQRFPELIILVTGPACIDTAVTAMKWGAYDYLVKPFHLPQLRRVFKQALE